jgi:hypothetical protein
LLWFVALNDFLNAFRELRGGQPIPPEGTTVSIPVIPDISPIVALVPTIAVVLLIVLAVLALRRLPNLWK